MKCLKNCTLLIFLLIVSVNAAEMKIKEELRAMAEQIQKIKTTHLADITRLQREVADLKQASLAHSTDNHDRNEQTTLEWATTSMNELRLEMKELSKSVNNSALLRQLHVIRNELKLALMQTRDLAQLARTHETRVDNLDNDVERIKYDGQQMRKSLADLRTLVGKLTKEMKTTELKELKREAYNDVLPHDLKDGEPKYEHIHKYRHNKMVHTQISRLSRTQDQLDDYQRNLQSQLLDVQRRLDRYEKPNWNLISAKMDDVEVETKLLRDLLNNMTLKMSDLDKVHASILELREDVESIENKADKVIPEFRKEISKLDVSYAQLNAQSSYMKEDQENLRQSVKAIAVSVSNTIDRAEIDRLAMKKINESVCELNTRAKQHYYRLNDHILKSEANTLGLNETDAISLPELMGEVKELEPVQREFEDLVEQLPSDCSGVSGPPGTYLIHPGHAPIDTWCINGSTVIQRRYNGSVEFNRNFVDYAQGFGDPASEYWMGLESMHLLTSDNCSSMRIDMTDIYGGVWYAQYAHFFVGNADTGYMLNVGGFEGNASDAFAYQNNMEFSAIDHDRDISNTHCAGNYEGGWWYSHCQHVNINGKYNLGLTWFDAARNEWIAVGTSEMRIFRRQGCS